MKKGAVILVATLALVFFSRALLAAPTFQSDNDGDAVPIDANSAVAAVAQMSVTENTITWEPTVDSTGLVLTISGPEGVYFSKDYPSNAIMSLGLVAEEGHLLPDGSYNYELYAIPVIDSQLFEEISEARAADDVKRLEEIDAQLPEVATQSGSFSIVDGQFVTAESAIDIVAEAAEEETSGNLLDIRDQQILDDLIVDGSACIGQDCVNGESFGFDTIRLKENNLRIKFQDTSNSASFPSNDWQITINDSNNGGANKFSIDDITGGRTPFTIEASAPSNSLYVDDGGRIGLGTSTPVVEVHIADGDTPTLRLEQNGSSGFQAQTWDVAGNETNFFVRDVTNGSLLPFKIKPGAPTGSLFIAADGDIGIGDESPEADLDVRGNAIIQNTDGTASLLVKDTTTAYAVRQMLELSNFGGSSFRLTNNASNQSWDLGQNLAGQFIIDNPATAGVTEFVMDSSGNVTIAGSLTTANQSGLDLPQDTLIADQQDQIDELEARIAELEAMINTLANQQEELKATGE